jgi:hypothetical protein
MRENSEAGITQKHVVNVLNKWMVNIKHILKSSKISGPLGLEIRPIARIYPRIQINMLRSCEPRTRCRQRCSPPTLVLTPGSRGFLSGWFPCYSGFRGVPNLEKINRVIQGFQRYGYLYFVFLAIPA